MQEGEKSSKKDFYSNTQGKRSSHGRLTIKEDFHPTTQGKRSNPRRLLLGTTQGKKTQEDPRQIPEQRKNNARHGMQLHKERKPTHMDTS